VCMDELMGWALYIIGRVGNCVSCQSRIVDGMVGAFWRQY
jgi:hypothetical protein